MDIREKKRVERERKAVQHLPLPLLACRLCVLYVVDGYHVVETVSSQVETWQQTSSTRPEEKSQISNQINAKPQMHACSSLVVADRTAQRIRKESSSTSCTSCTSFVYASAQRRSRCGMSAPAAARDPSSSRFHAKYSPSRASAYVA